MNKTAIKNFAIWARRQLIADITYKAGLIGISEKGIAAPLPQSKQDLQFFDIGTKKYAEVSGKEVEQRAALVSAIHAKEKTSDYKTAFQNVIEEVAYTWFNRLIAVRFMEVNDYLPSRVRVLSSETPKKNEPDIVTTPFDTDLDFTPYERDRVMQLKDENKLDELFRMLFIKQCNKLHDILPELFEKTGDYTELLLAISFTDKDDVVYHLVHDIQEDDFNVAKEGQVEIIGWLYQYYNTEPKDEVFALLKKNVKITKERIPAATQLFTPDWIVRYMVENSLGRLWVEQLETQKTFDFSFVDFNNFSFGEDENGSIAKTQSELKSNWKYYLDEAKQEESVKKQLYELRMSNKNYDISTYKLIDPCMGSGHILVYAFDVFMQIYISCGYSEKDAAASILRNNLYGLDIDDRAYQLAYFAVMMKARQYSRRIFGEHIEPNLCSIQQSNDLNPDYLSLFGKLKDEAQRLLDTFRDAKEYGCILTVPFTASEFAALREKLTEIQNAYYDNLFDNARKAGLVTLFAPILKQAEIMQRQYDVVVTNPPYMGSGGMSGKLAQYVKDYYPDSKSDLFAVFIERCGQMTEKNRYQAMITQHAWMFLSSFEKLRAKLIKMDTVNMAHLGARAFEEIGGEVVQTTSFVLRKSHIKDCKAVYCRLIEPTTQKGKEDMFLAGENRYEAAQDNFSKIPGSPVAYWASQNLLKNFVIGKSIKNVAEPKSGLSTTDNNRFLRLWHEVKFDTISFSITDISETEDSTKWFPIAKGGEYRKWYGNKDYVVNWQHNGLDIKKATKGAAGGRIVSPEYYFKELVTWSGIASGEPSMRISEHSIFGSGAKALLTENGLYSFLAFLNSKVTLSILKFLSPTLNYEAGHIGNIPACFQPQIKVEEITSQCIDASKQDWDSFETSWDFKQHPLVEYRHSVSKVNAPDSWYLENAYEAWEYQCQLRFDQLKANEEELNSIFIEIYGLQDELTPEVEDKDVTVRKADLGRDIRSLISYAVGCMFGRYSLDVEGLAYAGGEWDSGKYETYLPDADNCIPITDEEYFKDDIVGRFVEFIRTVYGAETLEENLDFIAKALGNKGNTSREVIRNYFLNDFFKNHCQIYQKRPIYWLFDSGKQNGFKALCYMHRWNADTIGNVRVEYLHKMQRVYEKEIERMQETVENSRNPREVAAAEKRKEKLTKQLKETKDYDAKIAHLALSRIDIDLDDGVKVNYEKVQTGQDGKKIEILGKV